MCTFAELRKSSYGFSVLPELQMELHGNYELRSLEGTKPKQNFLRFGLGLVTLETEASSVNIESNKESRLGQD
jgi:hypothetical protein